MNFVTLGTCWFASATVFGVLFSYSPWELTPRTSFVALFVGLLVSAAVLWRRGEAKPLKIGSWASMTAIAVSVLFLAFAVREFSQVIFVQNDSVRVLSRNNLGDICLHLTHINYLGASPRYWPDNPIFAFDKLRYPIGLNLFNAELAQIGIGPQLGIVLVALFGSLLTLRALLLFNGAFGVAGFLFNGGLAGFLFFQSFALKDYQQELAWKSIPLAMFITQRGLLYAVPAGLILLYHWRTTLFERRLNRGLPLWVEWLLYSTMPLFHLHTFLFLSFLLLWWFLFGDPNWRSHLLRLVLLSLAPASFWIYCITGFSKTGAVAWKPGWMADANGTSWWFWLQNFGLFLPACIAFAIYLCFPAKPLMRDAKQMLRLFFFPSAIVFLACCFVKFAPWEWDNTKLFFWAYLVMLFCLWEGVLKKWPWLARIPIFIGFFFSGFISLIGGSLADPQGFEIGRASEWRQVSDATHSFPPEAVFAIYPTYNHPLLVNGHRVVMGFPGHLWSHGLDYRPVEVKLQSLMQSDTNWQITAKELGVSYLFWGPLEQANYPESEKEWESTCRVVAQGPWGRIFDLRDLPEATPQSTEKGGTASVPSD
jgi:hypothetical protein